jgi:hypothetical protein
MGHDLNPGPPEHAVGVLTTRPRRSGFPQKLALSRQHVFKQVIKENVPSGAPQHRVQCPERLRHSQ